MTTKTTGPYPSCGKVATITRTGEVANHKAEEEPVEVSMPPWRPSLRRTNASAASQEAP